MVNSSNCSQETFIKTKYSHNHGGLLRNESTIEIGLLFDKVNDSNF